MDIVFVLAKENQLSLAFSILLSLLFTVVDGRELIQWPNPVLLIFGNPCLRQFKRVICLIHSPEPFIRAFIRVHIPADQLD